MWLNVARLVIVSVAIQALQWPVALFNILTFRLFGSLCKRYFEWTLRLFGYLLVYVTQCSLGDDAYLDVDDSITEHDQRIVIIANHQTYFDWIYIWLYLYARHPHHLSSLCIVLKSSLRSIPIFGWGMQCFDFLFLDRQLDRDRDRIIQRCSDSHHSLTLLIFPEGTVVNANTRAKAHASLFASEKNAEEARRLAPLKEARYVLPPRVTGLSVMLDAAKHLDAIYDCTLVYPRPDLSKTTLDKTSMEQYFTAKGFFSGNVDAFRSIKLSVKRLTNVPSSRDQVAKFLVDQFTEKENLLLNYYENQKLLLKNTQKWRIALRPSDAWVLAIITVGGLLLFVLDIYFLLWAIINL